MPDAPTPRQAHALQPRIDVFSEPEKALAGKIKCASAPFTYLNRLALKKSFKRMDGFAVIRSEPY